MARKKPKANKYVYWIPRIASILFIAFLSLFSLDVFGMGLGFWGTIAGLLIHNIPVFILIALLVIAWNYEIVGAVGFILGGVAYVIMVFMSGFEWYKLAWSIEIAGAAFIIGILFLIGWKQRKA